MGVWTGGHGYDGMAYKPDGLRNRGCHEHVSVCGSGSRDELHGNYMPYYGRGLMRPSIARMGWGCFPCQSSRDDRRKQSVLFKMYCF